MEHPAGKAMASDEQGELGFSSLTEITCAKEQHLQTWAEGREAVGCQNAVEKIIVIFKTSAVTCFCKNHFFLLVFHLDHYCGSREMQ